MNVLFVCTGNSCRSPMAEVAFSDLLQRRGVTGVVARSAGLAAFPGTPATPQAAFAVSLEGLNLGEHRARTLDAELIDWADLVVPMTRAHANQIRHTYPAAGEKTRTLLSFAGKKADVDDPIGGDSETYVRCLETMKPALEALARFVAE